MPRRPAEADRVDFLAGEVHALLCFALAMSEAFPDQNLLRELFEKASQTGLANLETTLVGDKTIAGFQYICERISVSLQE